MDAMTWCLILATLALLFDGFFLYHHFKKKPKRSAYHKEFDKYYEIMKGLGFDDEYIAHNVLEFKSFDDLREHNKKYKRSISA